MSTTPVAVTIDEALPMLDSALDLECATRAIQGVKAYAGALVGVHAARLVRHKPGRRAVIEFDLSLTWPDGAREHLTAIGKMRARRLPRAAYRLQREFWRGGFSATSHDGISVPEPIGVVPALGLWLQRKVPGQVATDVLTTPAGAPLARRIAEAAFKIHRAAIAPQRAHGPDEEVAILTRVLALAADHEPSWRRQITELLAGCQRLSAHMGGPATGIHRDFYADQIVVDGARLYLLDFDLYCAGPPALDVGNFAGHLAEQQVREPQHAAALAAAEHALEASYGVLAGEAGRTAARVCSALTLARHVYLSTVLPGRAPSAARVLDLASARVEALLDELA